MNNSREKGHVQAKQEAGDTTTTTTTNTDDRKVTKISYSSSSSSRQWAGFKNPRIVRVSRAFGGKDRHSKVCTVRGLRDRRIRLSVPTALQLYDLQHKLGLSQPSKVVDWLLDATKHDIDKLPPLQMPPGSFMSQFINHQPPPALFSHESSQASLSQVLNGSSARIRDDGGININEALGRSREAAAKDKWNINDNHQVNLDNYGAHISAQNLFPLPNQSSSFPGVLNSTTFPYNSYFHWEPSSLSLSPFGNHSFASHTVDDHSHNNHSSLMAIPSACHQLYLSPPLTTLPSVLPPPPYAPGVNASAENEPRQNNHLQLLSSSSSQHCVLSNTLMPTLHLINSPAAKSFISLNNLPASQEK